jgi:RecB family exonuclease
VLARLVPEADVEVVEPATPPTPVMQHLFRAPEDPPPQPDAARWVARDRAEEVRAVGRWVRDLLGRGVVDGPWEVALVLPGSGAYADLVQEILPGMGLELDLQRPGTLDTSEVGRTLVALVEGAARGWPRRQLVQLLRAPWLDFSTPEHAAPDPDLLDQAGRSEGVLGGRDDWLQALSHLVGRHRAAAPESEDPRARARRMAMAQRVEALRDSLAGVFDRLAPLEAADDARDFARQVERLLGELGAVPGLLQGHDAARTAEDVAVLRAFLELLEALGQVEGLTGEGPGLEQLEALVQAALPDTRPAPRSGGAGLVVCDAQHAGAREWQAMALVGFAEGAYPAAPPRVPMLGGAPLARAAFRRLPTYADEPREDLYRLLAACAGPLLLTRPAEEEGVPLLPAPFWEDLGQTITWAPAPGALEDDAGWSPDPRRYQAQLARGLVAPAEDPGDDARDAAALALHDAEAGAVALRLRAEQARRKGDEVGRFLGFLEDPGLLAWVGQEFGPEAVLPITLLEGFAQCPFRFFARHLLGLEASEELREDVDAAARGLLVHDVLHRFMEPRRGGEVPPDEDLEASRDRLAAILDVAFADPRLRGFFWRHERRRLLGTSERPGMLDDWLELEANLDRKAPGRRPSLLEWGFGTATTAPLLVPAETGPPVKLRGRVDRVDQVDAGYLVWDYKTGGVNRPIPKQRAFIQLQLPLYLLAVARRAGLPGMPLGGSYLQLQGRGKVAPRGGFGRAEVLGRGGAFPLLERATKARSDASWKLGAEDEPTLEAWLARTERRVVELARRLGAGRYFAFRHPEAHRCVEYCDYRDVCRVEEAEAHHDFSPEVIPPAPRDASPEEEPPESGAPVEGEEAPWPDADPPWLAAEEEP